MLVVFLVARITIHRCVLVPFVGVADFARHTNVFIAKLVTGLVMVESDVLP